MLHYFARYNQELFYWPAAVDVDLFLISLIFR